MMKKEITLKDIAGYSTERTVWQMILNLSAHGLIDKISNITPHAVAIVGNDFLLKEISLIEADSNRAFAAPETFNKNIESNSEASAIWTLGALAFYVITSTNVFEGKGGETQTELTEIPRISSVYASSDLSTLIQRCLCFSPQKRPTIKEIRQKAEAALNKYVEPRKRLVSHTGKSYAASLVKFWPEEMIPLLLICLLLLSSISLPAQSLQGVDKTVIPNEMASLVLRCIDLRSSQNAGKVSRAMDRDMNWTMMDELPVDKAGECTTKDAVDMFGLNDMGFGILKRHGGVTNSGGRFRDGRDPRYKYSFIEITVKQSKSVRYSISGREGEQLFAVVPYDKNAKFEVMIRKDGKDIKGSVIDGVSYIRLRQGIKKSDTFTLTLSNHTGKNMAFALINYNSRNNE